MTIPQTLLRVHVSPMVVVAVLGGCNPAAISVGHRATPATAQPLAVGSIEYPAARKSDVVDKLHGELVADPYRWLEDLGAAETRTWVEAENAVTRHWFAGVPTREHIARALVSAHDFERSSFSPKKRGTRWFFARNSGHQNQPVLFVADSLLGAPRAIADFNEISPDGKLAYAGSSVSPRGTYVAYGLSIGGSDWVEWHVRDVASGRDLPDRIEWTKYYWPTWTADEQGLYYSRFPRPEPGQELTAQDLGCTVRLHRLGTDATADPIIHERRDQPTYQFEPRVTADGRWLVITTGDGEVGDRGVEELAVLDLAAPAAKSPLRPLVEGFDAEYLYVTNDGPTFVLKTTHAAPTGQVIAVDVRTPARTSWQTIVPAGNATIHDVVCSGERLLVTTLVDASARLFAVGLDGRGRFEIALPGAGTARPFPMPRDEAAAFYQYTSFDTPPTTFRHDFATGNSEPIHPPHAAIDPAGFEAREVFYASKDGTRIPMFVVHRKGLVLDGTNPTYLTGYGASAAATTPEYSPTLAWWLASGGVLAIPVIRGGTEYGEAWAKAAEKTHRQVAFDDFIAAAEWLIAQRITSAPKLAIAGASNGGLLVAAVAVQRPELFGAVVVKVGVLDMLRFPLAGQGAGWQGVYGSYDPVAVPRGHLCVCTPSQAHGSRHDARPAHAHQAAHRYDLRVRGAGHDHQRRGRGGAAEHARPAVPEPVTVGRGRRGGTRAARAAAGAPGRRRRQCPRAPRPRSELHVPARQPVRLRPRAGNLPRPLLPRAVAPRPGPRLGLGGNLAIELGRARGRASVAHGGVEHVDPRVGRHGIFVSRMIGCSTSHSIERLPVPGFDTAEIKEVGRPAPSG